MSPTTRPSGCGSGYAITSVRPRRPVARRLARRISAAESSVISTWEPAGARSHPRTRWATSISFPAPGTARGSARDLRRRAARRMPGRTDPATGLRVVDAIVIHPAQHDQECGFDLLDLLECQRGFIELAGVHFRANDVVDRFFDLLWRQILEHAQRRLDRIRNHGDRRLHRARLGTRIGEVLDVAGLVAVGLFGLIEEVRD